MDCRPQCITGADPPRGDLQLLSSYPRIQPGQVERSDVSPLLDHRASSNHDRCRRGDHREVQLVELGRMGHDDHGSRSVGSAQGKSQRLDEEPRKDFD